MNAAYLRYLLAIKGISAGQLAEEMEWSSAVCYRRRYGLTDWTVPEVRKLSQMGFTNNEIKNIFFSDDVSK